MCYNTSVDKRKLNCKILSFYPLCLHFITKTEKSYTYSSFLLVIRKVGNHGKIRRKIQRKYMYTMY